MLVEFSTVVTDYEEQRERGLQAEISGESSVPVYHTKDKLCISVIDMSLVIGWDGAYIFFNDERRACVYAIFMDEGISRALLIEPEKFKQLFTVANRKDVHTPEILLNEFGI